MNDVMHGACFTRSFLFQTGSLALPNLFVLAFPQSHSVPTDFGVHKEPPTSIQQSEFDLQKTSSALKGVFSNKYNTTTDHHARGVQIW